MQQLSFLPGEMTPGERSLIQMFHLLGENCAVLAVKLVDKTKCTERLPMSI